jgi:hypothetical protein
VTIETSAASEASVVRMEMSRDGLILAKVMVYRAFAPIPVTVRAVSVD